MKMTKWTEAFLASTKGRIVSLLRGMCRTVNDLANALGFATGKGVLVSAVEADSPADQAGIERGRARKDRPVNDVQIGYVVRPAQRVDQLRQAIRLAARADRVWSRGVRRRAETAVTAWSRCREAYEPWI